MAELKPFVAQLARLALIIAAILGGLAIVTRLPMVAALERLPAIGISARDLLTAMAYVAILVLLVSFAKKIEAVVVKRPGGLSWQSIVAQVLILFGVVFVYRTLGPFATALLGPYVWVYPAVLLAFACIPVFGIGRIFYEFVSEQLERWEG